MKPLRARLPPFLGTSSEVATHSSHIGLLAAVIGPSSVLSYCSKTTITLSALLSITQFVAYDGTFVLDAQTQSLVQLTVHVNQVPATMHVCEATTVLDYETKNIRGTDFLVPKSAESVVVRPDGSDFQNKTAFSGCEEFHGESTLNFGELHTRQTSAASSSSRPSSFPAGISFTVALTESINPSTAAAGDIVRAKLTGPIRDKHKATLAPKDSIVVGRLMQVEKISGVYGPGIHSLRVGIKLETIEIEAMARPFVANLMSLEKRRIKPVDAPAEGQWDKGSGADRLVRREDLGSFDQMMNPDDAAVGYLLFDDVTDDYIIRAGTQMTGTTTKVQAER